MDNLPEMTVEKRESTTAHAVPAPIFDRKMELQKTIELNHYANFEGWHGGVIEILRQYIPNPTSYNHITTSVMNVTGFRSWREVVVFVQDDMCLEFFNMALQYCLREGQAHKKEKGFIDGSGIGYVKTYTKRLKTTLEQCFDAKYFYQEKRPLSFALDQGLNLSNIANHIHPGHWSYPAGHGTKFLTAVEVLNDIFHLDSNCYKSLLTAASVCSMGRSGSLIHYPSDNLAGGALTTLKEFN